MYKGSTWYICFIWESNSLRVGGGNRGRLKEVRTELRHSFRVIKSGKKMVLASFILAAFHLQNRMVHS